MPASNIYFKFWNFRLSFQIYMKPNLCLYEASKSHNNHQHFPERICPISEELNPFVWDNCIHFLFQNTYIHNFGLP